MLTICPKNGARDATSGNSLTWLAPLRAPSPSSPSPFPPVGDARRADDARWLGRMRHRFPMDYRPPADTMRGMFTRVWMVVYVPDAERERDALPANERHALYNTVAKLQAIGAALGYPHTSAVQGTPG